MFRTPLLTLALIVTTEVNAKSEPPSYCPAPKELGKIIADTAYKYPIDNLHEKLNYSSHKFDAKKWALSTHYFDFNYYLIERKKGDLVQYGSQIKRAYEKTHIQCFYAYGGKPVSNKYYFSLAWDVPNKRQCHYLNGAALTRGNNTQNCMQSRTSCPFTCSN